ncbi:MAG: AAA family ATPase [Gemmatimonadaceae bacterium]
MIQRKALIVGGAGGPEEQVGGILMRFGFSGPVQAPSVDAALEQLGQGHFDLVIVPVQDMGVVQLSALEREIRRGRFTFVIGTSPRADPELILRAMRAGIHEFLVFPPEPKDLAGAVDRLMRRQHADKERGQVIAVYSGKGGLGTTTIAVNLAYGFAKNRVDARVALADFVVLGGDVRVLLNLKPTYDMGDLAQKLDRVDAELLYSLLTPCPGGVWALPGPDNPESDELLDANTINTILDQLRTHFAFTIVDCEHHLSERTLAAMDMADRILLVTQLTIPALRSTQRALELCRRLGYTADKTCVIVNRYNSGDMLSPKDAADVLKCDLFWRLPNEYRVTAEALTKGVPVGELDSGSRLAGSFTQLSAKLGGMVASNNSDGARDRSRLRQFFGIKKRA